MSSKILVVESDAPLAARIEAALRARGIEVAIVRDAAGAIDAARAERPDAIVLSAELSGGSGFVVCNRLRKDPELRDIPLVITSAEASEDTFEQHRRLKTHADAYVRKPFAVADLLQRLGGVAQLPETDARPALDDADLLAFDAAFDSIAQMEAAAGPVERPISEEDAAAAAALLEGLPDVDEPIADFSAIATVRGVASPAFEAELGTEREVPVVEPPSRTPAPAPAPAAAESDAFRERITSLEHELAAARAERDAALQGQAALEQRLAAAERLLGTAKSQRERTREAIATALSLLGGD